MCRDIKTHGPWDVFELTKHINELELIAALYGLKCFTKESREISVI